MVILRLPLVAFIDVVLFMLLYFVVAADLTPSEAYLSTALKTDARGKGQGTSLLPQIVRVESDGANVRYKIGDRVLADRASLLALLRQLPKEAGIVVRVSNEVPVSAAATAVAAGREAGFTRISYVPAR
jgi:biopolymer transport protein ExbD